MSFTCPRCSRTSHNPEDERQGYCGACHAFTGAFTATPAGPPEYGCPRCGVRFEVPPDHIGPVQCASYGCAGAPMTEITPYVIETASFRFEPDLRPFVIAPDGSTVPGPTARVHAEPGWADIAVSADAAPGTVSFECPVTPFEAPQRQSQLWDLDAMAAIIRARGLAARPEDMPEGERAVLQDLGILDQPRPYSWADMARMAVERLRSGQMTPAEVFRYIRERYAPTPAESLEGLTVTASGIFSETEFAGLASLLGAPSAAERSAESAARHEALIRSAEEEMSRPYAGRVTTRPSELPPEEAYGAYRWRPGDPEW